MGLPVGASTVLDGSRVEVQRIERAIIAEHPEVVLPNYLEVDQVDVDGVGRASVGVDD